MKTSKIALLVLMVVAGLAAGTALVAGHAEKANVAAKVTCQGDCDQCPMQGTEACCETGTSCSGDQSGACAGGPSAPGCESQAAGCPRKDAPAASSEMPGCSGCDMACCTAD
jgi:hypothetical protein